MKRFYLRDLFWLTLAVAAGLGGFAWGQRELRPWREYAAKLASDCSRFRFDASFQEMRADHEAASSQQAWNQVRLLEAKLNYLSQQLDRANLRGLRPIKEDE